tara:strand:- start:476 stop:1498 length:1023 start_codon:yes stop_codon:yes gene_type:complete
MSSIASQQSIRSIIRRSTLTTKHKLNILTFCTHERYEQNLCRTGHNFYSIKHGKTWNTDFGKIPQNYEESDVAPWHVNFDLILCHTSCERISLAKQLQNLFNVPILRHTHVLPDIRFDIAGQVEGFNAIPVDHNSFISNYSMSQWGNYKNNTTSVIEHGVDVDFWDAGENPERDNVLLSVVNQWPDRDWCCGWNLWKETVRFQSPEAMPIRVLGDSPGLSRPADSIESLRHAYKSSSVFLNTSIHSPVPTVLMEAMASGCAVVSTNNCMIPEIIQHGENGLLADTADELRSSCQYLLDNPSKARELGEAAKKTMQDKFNLQRFVDDWNNLLFSVIDNYRK